MIVELLLLYPQNIPEAMSKTRGFFTDFAVILVHSVPQKFQYAS